jgi:hypothetical protein
VSSLPRDNADQPAAGKRVFCIRNSKRMAGFRDRGPRRPRIEGCRRGRAICALNFELRGRQHRAALCTCDPIGGPPHSVLKDSQRNNGIGHRTRLFAAWKSTRPTALLTPRPRHKSAWRQSIGCGIPLGRPRDQPQPREKILQAVRHVNQRA